MSLITYNPKWNNKRAETVPHDKARRIADTLVTMPAGLSDEQLDYLSHIEKIYFSDGTMLDKDGYRKYSTDPVFENLTVNDTWVQETQGKMKAAGE